MESLKRVNRQIGNLHQHMVTQVQMHSRRLAVQFQPTSADAGAFCLVLDPVLFSIDRGLGLQPLTAGLAWKPSGSFREIELPLFSELDGADIVALRLDYEDEAGLHCRFQAVAGSINVHDGWLNDLPDRGRFTLDSG